MEKYLRNLHPIPFRRENLKSVPQTAGVYVFFKGKTPIYIGKANNIKRRLSSYLDLNLEPKTRKMVTEARYISFVKVTSELEALLLEAKLIRKFMPHYNIAAKDDKHPLYIIITKEEYPRVISARKPDLANIKTKSVYGPFPSSANVRSVARMIRRIFPYSDHKLGTRPCLYSHIGLCSPCPNSIELENGLKTKKAKKQIYLSNIKKVKKILDGKIGTLVHDLESEMKIASASLNFEAASELRDSLQKLQYITSPQIPVEGFMENPNLYEDLRNKETLELKQILSKWDIKVKKLKRIECFDIAHLAGTNPTASMVTFIDGEADKTLYRHFRIRQKKGGSDTDSLKEVIKRRRKHLKTWGRPDLVIVDGGKPQVGTFIRELENEDIAVIGIAKRFETLVIPVKKNSTLILKEYKLPRGSALNLVQRMRDEAHRFARKYHHTLISKNFQ
ncbi:MAG TPA: UvrB/UvrC motif-containing protein [Patescibacteria group bacterium]|nr:UvrB/UvrC motif-containing protein [Patescibacteria group bacterium]